MKTYIKGDIKETMCIEDSTIVLLTSPTGEPLVLIEESGSNSITISTPETGEQEFYDRVIAAGFSLEAKS